MVASFTLCEHLIDFIGEIGSISKWVSHSLFIMPGFLFTISELSKPFQFETWNLSTATAARVLFSLRFRKYFCWKRCNFYKPPWSTSENAMNVSLRPLYPFGIYDVVLVCLLLTLNIFSTLFWCFRCWLGASTYRWVLFLEVLPIGVKNVSKVIICVTFKWRQL